MTIGDIPAALLVALFTGIASGLTTWGAIRVTLSWHAARLDAHDKRLNIHSARIRMLELRIAGRRRPPPSEAELLLAEDDAESET